jgi:peptidoglycan/LPS O-acetylase OafA/YrhL
MGVPLSRQHVPALDGVRGVAILLVAACHGGMTILPEGPGAVDTLRHLFYQGVYGVDLFFVLSGYLITGILLDTRDDPGYFRTFYWRRALRIFPAYYAYLALVFLVLRPLFAPWGPPAWPYLIYVQNYLPGHGEGQPLLGHLWSLAVEEQFYLCWPALVYLVPQRRLALVCVVLAVGALGLRCAFALTGQHMEDAHRFTPARLDTLLLGALLALAVRSDRWLAWCRTWLPRAGLLAAVAILMLARGTNGFDMFSPLVYTAGWSLTALVSGAVVFAAATPGGGPLRRVLCWRWLRSFGRYSYAIYLLHPLITQLVPVYWLRLLSHQPVAVYWLGVLAFPLVVALGGWVMGWVSWHVLERPFLRLKDRFAYAPR